MNDQEEPGDKMTVLEHRIREEQKLTPNDAITLLSPVRFVCVFWNGWDFVLIPTDNLTHDVLSGLRYILSQALPMNWQWTQKAMMNAILHIEIVQEASWNRIA